MTMSLEEKNEFAETETTTQEDEEAATGTETGEEKSETGEE
jgi:hypothetical protein